PPGKPFTTPVGRSRQAPPRQFRSTLRSVMKTTFPSIAVLFAAPLLAAAQVASHAPTIVSTPPSSAQSRMAPIVSSAAPIAKVNGTVLTQADLVREEFAIFPYARQHNGIPKELEPEIREGAMKMMIFEELVYQEALRRSM